MVTPREVLAAMIKHCEIGLNQIELNNYDFEERVVDPLTTAGFDFDFDSGASKGVLVFDSFVIKVPYMARTCDSDEYTHDLCAWDRGELSAEPILEDYLQTFSCATNLHCETENEWDYCELECAIYQIALKEGLEPYFAKEMLLGEVRGYPVYVQQLVVPYSEAVSSSLTIASDEKRHLAETTCDSLNLDCFNETWIADFITLYGKDEFEKLSLFLRKMRIYDLHGGNVGYMNGYPVILDYSNFNE